MKSFIICFVLLIGFQCMKAQSFQETTKFIVKTEVKEDGAEFPTYVVNLIYRGGTSEKLITLSVDDPELFEEISVITLEDPGLDGVSEVIKIQIEYLSCCAEVDSYYYILKNNMEIIPLPRLTNIYCDKTNTESQYIFPNQSHGIDNNIMETEISYTDQVEASYIDIKQKLIWENNETQNTKSTALTGF